MTPNAKPAVPRMRAVDAVELAALVAAIVIPLAVSVRGAALM